MKVTFFIGGLSGGGAERVICNIANYLVERGHECLILTMSEDETSYFIDERIKLETLLPNDRRASAIANLLIRVKALIKYLKKSDTDKYVVFLPCTTILFLFFRKCTKADVIVSERADPSKYSKTVQKLLRLLAKRADQWVFQTDEAMAWYGSDVRNGIVIPNAINPEFILPMFEGERKKVIASAGRLNAQKNFSLLVEAFSEIAPEFPDYRLVIYGEGEKRAELEQLALDKGLSDRIDFPGYVTSLGGKIADSSLFVLTSNYEGMPNALMEAMALGLPVIATDCPAGGPKFLIKNGVNGRLLPVGNGKELSSVMVDVLSNPTKAEAMGNEARKISQELSPGKIYGRWEELICTCV